MTNAFATDPERACYAIWTVWAVSWFLAAGWSSRAQSRASIAQQLPYRLLTIVGFVCFSLCGLTGITARYDSGRFQSARAGRWFCFA